MSKNKRRRVIVRDPRAGVPARIRAAFHVIEHINATMTDRDPILTFSHGQTECHERDSRTLETKEHEVYSVALDTVRAYCQGEIEINDNKMNSSAEWSTMPPDESGHFLFLSRSDNIPRLAQVAAGDEDGLFNICVKHVEEGAAIDRDGLWLKIPDLPSKS